MIKCIFSWKFTHTTIFFRENQQKFINFFSHLWSTPIHHQRLWFLTIKAGWPIHPRLSLYPHQRWKTTSWKPNLRTKTKKLGAMLCWAFQILLLQKKKSQGNLIIFFSFFRENDGYFLLLRNHCLMCTYF